MREWVLLGILVALGLRQNAYQLSATATGLDNDPGPRDWLPLLRLRLAASTLPEGTTWTSAHRGDAVNFEVGGVASSDHRLDLALDVLPPPGRTMEWLENSARASGVWRVVLNELTHVHLAL